MEAIKSAVSANIDDFKADGLGPEEIIKIVYDSLSRGFADIRLCDVETTVKGYF
jgi:hypothetical protein